jgi:hypothetical protein
LFIICICGENATVFVDFTKKSDLTPGLKADIYSSRRVLKTPGVETIFICMWSNHSGGLILGCELYFSACRLTFLGGLMFGY